MGICFLSVSCGVSSGRTSDNQVNLNHKDSKNKDEPPVIPIPDPFPKPIPDPQPVPVPIKLTKIEIKSSETTMKTNHFDQLSAIGTYDDGTTQDLTGKVQWQFNPVNVVSAPDKEGKIEGLTVGSVQMTASLEGVTSQTQIQDVQQQYAFFANYFSGSMPFNMLSGSIVSCSMNNDGTFNTCKELKQDVFNQPSFVTINTNSTQAYVVNNVFFPNSNTIQSSAVFNCSVLADGTFSECHPMTADTVPFASKVILNSDSSVAYVIHDIKGDNTTALTVCSIDKKGDFQNCTTQTDKNLIDVKILNQNKRAFVLNENTDSENISTYPIKSDGSLDDTNQKSTRDENMGAMTNLTLNQAGTRIFIANTMISAPKPTYDVDILSCPINDAFDVGTCQVLNDSTFNQNFISNIQLNQSENLAYIFNLGGPISSCVVNLDGTFGSCKNLQIPIISEKNFFSFVME